MNHLRNQWRRRIEGARPEDLYGTKANVTGRPSANCIVHYNRDTDTLVFVAKRPTSYDPSRLEPEDLVPPGGQTYYTPPGRTFGPIGLANGAQLDIENGEIACGSGGASPTTPTFFNPLYIEALQRLLDTFPEFGRYPLYEGTRYDSVVTGTARQFLTNLNDMRGVFAEGSRKLAWREVCFYHGTVGQYADEIMREGINPRSLAGVENHWSDSAISRDGLVYLSHPSRLTVSRSAMNKAGDQLFEAEYGDQIEALSDEYRTISSRYRSMDSPGAKEAYEAHWEKKQKLDRIRRTDPRFEAVLLRVCIPREGWKNLRADEDTEDYAKATTEMTGMPEWMGSLGSDAVVAYEGTIPPQWVEVVARGEQALRAGMSGQPKMR